MALASIDACLPAGHGYVASVYELPGITSSVPIVALTPGAVAYDVAIVAGELSCRNSIPPLPDSVKLDVVSWLCMGKRKTSEHVFPAYDAGKSNSKMLETVELTVVKKDVPWAMLGFALEMGMIRCGNR